MTTNLSLDLVGLIGHEDGGAGGAGAHLGLGSLQGREELGVDHGRLEEADPRRHVPRHAEERILYPHTNRMYV